MAPENRRQHAIPKDSHESERGPASDDYFLQVYMIYTYIFICILHIRIYIYIYIYNYMYMCIYRYRCAYT